MSQQERCIPLPEDYDESEFRVRADSLDRNLESCASITLYGGFDCALAYVSPANLRAIAAACVEAADELEGKS